MMIRIAEALRFIIWIADSLSLIVINNASKARID